MCLPSGRPEHPSRSESYLKWTAEWRGGAAVRGGGGGEKKKTERIIFMGFLFKRSNKQPLDRWREAGREVGGGGAEEWEGLVQMDCLQRAAVPLASFTSPLSAALVFPLTGENRGGGGLGSRHWQALLGLGAAYCTDIMKKNSSLKYAALYRFLGMKCNFLFYASFVFFDFAAWFSCVAQKDSLKPTEGCSCFI